MSDEDNFDIDIYGDGEDETVAVELDDPVTALAASPTSQPVMELPAGDHKSLELREDRRPDGEMREDQNTEPHINNTSGSDSLQIEDQQQSGTTVEDVRNATTDPRQAPVQQGLKRKQGVDDRSVDPGASSALMVSEVQWWVTDDDIRGWSNQCKCEDELKDVTFNEHKVNGKSKGQVYLEFTTPQAATAVKHKIELFNEDLPAAKQYTAAFASSTTNPFKTLPKDGPARQGTNQTTPNGNAQFGGVGRGGGFVNGNGNFRGRGSGVMTNNRGAMGSRGSFGGGAPQTPMTHGGIGGMTGGYGTPQMGAFNNAGFGGHIGGYGNFNRGGMMMGGGSMRGGGIQNRGGRGGPVMMPANGMLMGAMPMQSMMSAGMGMGMGMGMPMGGMQGYYNPAFSQGQAMNGGTGDWNPHGQKRPRQGE